jgi:hypothetical protein
MAEILGSILVDLVEYVCKRHTQMCGILGVILVYLVG